MSDRIRNNFLWAEIHWFDAYMKGFISMADLYLFSPEVEFLQSLGLISRNQRSLENDCISTHYWNVSKHLLDPEWHLWIPSPLSSRNVEYKLRCWTKNIKIAKGKNIVFIDWHENQFWGESDQWTDSRTWPLLPNLTFQIILWWFFYEDNMTSCNFLEDYLKFLCMCVMR